MNFFHFPGRFVRRYAMVALASVTFGMTRSAMVAKPSEVKIKVVPSDPSLARLSTEELIDRLQTETEIEIPPKAEVQPTDASLVSPHSTATRHFSTFEMPALERAFLPVENSSDFTRTSGGGFFSPRHSGSAVMTELVRRGVAALPALLVHLSDARPTQLTWPARGTLARAKTLNSSLYGFEAGLADYYEPRYLNRHPWPDGVNTVDVGRSEAKFGPQRSYVFKVADLCFGAIGQITNRTTTPLSSGPFYDDPASGKMSILALGHFGLIISPIEYPSLAQAARRDWVGLTRSDHEAALRGDADLLNDRDGQKETVAFSRRLSAIQRLLFYYPETGRQVVDALLEIDLAPLNASQKADFIAALMPFRWDGLDAAVWKLYRHTIDDIPDGTAVDLGRLDLAFACARRLAHQEHDADFQQFLRKEIPMLTGGPKFGRGERVEAFLRELDAAHPSK